MSIQILDSCPVHTAGHCPHILFAEFQLCMIFINACYFILKEKKKKGIWRCRWLISTNIFETLHSQIITRRIGSNDSQAFCNIWKKLGFWIVDRFFILQLLLIAPQNNQGLWATNRHAPKRGKLTMRWSHNITIYCLNFISHFYI